MRARCSVLLIMAAACASSGDASKSAHGDSTATPGRHVENAAWTVMVFMNADNSLDADAYRNLKQIARLPTSNQINVVAQLDRQGDDPIDAGHWTQTIRLKVDHSLDGVSYDNLPGKAVADLGEQNMGDGHALRAFVDWAQQSYPAQHYMLVIWNHGQGWRLILQQQLAALQRARQARRDYTHSSWIRPFPQRRSLSGASPPTSIRQINCTIGKSPMPLWA